MARRYREGQKRIITYRALTGTKGRAQLFQKNHPKLLILLATSEGFEPPTPRFEVWCSIQLSYEVCSERVRWLASPRGIEPRSSP